MDHIGWTRRHTALHYLQLAKVLNPAGASTRLSAGDIPALTSEWSDINDLKRFVCAFPSATSQKGACRLIVLNELVYVFGLVWVRVGY